MASHKRSTSPEPEIGAAKKPRASSPPPHPEIKTIDMGADQISYAVIGGKFCINPIIHPAHAAAVAASTQEYSAWEECSFLTIPPDELPNTHIYPDGGEWHVVDSPAASFDFDAAAFYIAKYVSSDSDCGIHEAHELKLDYSKIPADMKVNPCIVLQPDEVDDVVHGSIAERGTAHFSVEDIDGIFWFKSDAAKAVDTNADGIYVYIDEQHDPCVFVTNKAVAPIKACQKHCLAMDYENSVTFPDKCSECDRFHPNECTSTIHLHPHGDDEEVPTQCFCYYLREDLLPECTACVYNLYFDKGLCEKHTDHQCEDAEDFYCRLCDKPGQTLVSPTELEKPALEKSAQ